MTLTRMLTRSLTVWTGLAALAAPLAAAEPMQTPSKPAAIVQISNPGIAVEYPPPAPLAPLPMNSYAPNYSPSTILANPPAPMSSTYPTYSPATPTYSPTTTTYAPSVGVGSSYGPPSSYYTATGSGAAAIYGTPGGYEARIGSPYHYFDPNGGQYAVSGNPYNDHFGPGFHRQSLHGHYRFPYYNYRAPWYYPGRAVYNRDTNFAW